MGTAGNRVVRKQFRLDAEKLKQALGAATETETVENAQRPAISEEERDRMAWEAHERFLHSGAKIRDCYGELTDRISDAYAEVPEEVGMAEIDAAVVLERRG